MEEPKAGHAAVEFCQKTDVLRSIKGGYWMSERLRNAMEQGERMRHPPSRNEKQDSKETRACGWLVMERSGMADQPQ